MTTQTQGPFTTADLAWTFARAAEAAGYTVSGFRQDDLGFWFDAEQVLTATEQAYLDALTDADAAHRFDLDLMTDESDAAYEAALATVRRAEEELAAANGAARVSELFAQYHA